MRRAFGSIFVVALAIFSAPPAFADDRQVRVADDVFMPSAVAVKPGESVTWSNPGSTDLHNVTFEDGEFSSGGVSRGPWEATRPFAEEDEGAYRYYCLEHGGPGGSGMSGTVFVNEAGTFPGAQPVASFTASPDPAVVGRSVSFNAAASTDPDGRIAKYEWDFDGDGTFETDGGSTPTISRTYSRAGPVSVKLRVTDAEGVTGEATRSFSVTDAPVSSFTISPSPIQTGQTATFDGSASADPDGTIAKYEWDLDGDGSFETDTGTTPTASRSYTTAATLTVRLRVTDDTGVAAETTRSLRIDAPPPAPPAQPDEQEQPTPRPACSSLKGAKRATCIQRRTCGPLKGAKRARCVRASCRSVARAKRGACIRKSCRYLKRSKRRACGRKSCRVLRGSKRRACARRYSRKRKAGRRATASSDPRRP